MASISSQKTHFLDLEQRWLRAAESVAPKTVRETKAPIAQPNIATPDVDQPLQGAQENDVAAPRRPDEIGDERARSAKIPLRLSNNAVAMLTLEAQVREISLGQLVGMLIEAAMAQDLSRVLDKNPTDEPE
jgi:hypothetical protein